MDARWRTWRARKTAGTVVLLLVAASPLWPFPGSPARAETLTVTASADVSVAAEGTPEPGSPSLGVDGSPEQEAFLRFSLPALPGPVSQATLRLFVADRSGNGPEVYRTSTGWAEDSLTWASRPDRQGGLLDDTGSLSEGAWATWDVTAAVAGGSVGFVLVADSTDGTDFDSTEAPGNRPELVLEVGGSAPGGESAAFSPAADTRVDESEPGTNFGTSRTLSSQGEPDPRVESFLRFNVAGLPGAVTRARLRLLVTNDTDDAPALHRTSGSWDETAMTWLNRPAPAGGAVSDLGGVGDDVWVEYDVTAAVTGNGSVGFVLVSDSADSFSFRSREASSGERPELVVDTGGATTTSGPTTTTTRATTTTTRPPTTTTTRPPTTITTRPPTTTTTRPPAADCDPPDWRDGEIVGELPHGYAEMSGLVPSSRYPGWAWGIRDSGNPASLYAFRLPSGGDTAPVFEFPVPGTSNSDWEDVAYTRSGTGPGILWILENRGNLYTGNRVIYQVAEPDPTDPGPATLLGRYEFRYPDGQWNSETLFVFDGDLVLVSKTSPARLYRFEAKPLPLTVNVPVLVGTLSAGSNPSIASVSPDGRLLAVGSHSSLRVWENDGDLSDLSALIAGAPVFSESLPDDNREGGAFFPAGSCDIVMVAESKNLWRLEHR